MKNDIYSVKGRLLNHIAFDDITITSVGNILVNMYAHVLMGFYGFIEKYDHHTFIEEELAKLVEKAETFPRDVIKLANPAPQKSLYEQVMEAKPLYPDNQSALRDYQIKYEELGGDKFWMEAESDDITTPEYFKIMKLARTIQMLKYLIEKENE